MGPPEREDIPQRRLANLPPEVLLSKGAGLLQVAPERPEREAQRKPLQIHPGCLQTSGEDNRQQGDLGRGGKGVRCEAAS